jgi:hypothetical protein
MVLLNQNGYQNGLALEVPGDAIILRPGNDSTAPVFAVHQAACFAIGGGSNVKFLFVYSPGFSSQNEAFFGRIYASTSSDGSSWQFSNQTEYIAPYEYESAGYNVPSDADYPGYPSSYPGACSVSNGAAAVISNPSAYFSGGPTPPPILPTQYVISPSGFFFENQNYGSVISAGIGNWSIPTISAWGVSEPLVPIATSSLTTVNYVGFLFETANNNSTYRTRLVGFGNTPKSGVMIGGTFPNEDPTQAPTENMSITFGKQDPLNNGVYYLATLTTPNDSVGFTGSCVKNGLSQSGTPTCINDAVVTVGYPFTENYPNNKFTIILSATDTSGNQEMLVLFQQ